MSEQELNNVENSEGESSPETMPENLTAASETNSKNENGKLGFKRSIFHKIVNSFISAFLILIIIILLVVGITQTSTFREFLRKKVISLVNEEINGRLNIEKINGTVLTSLSLRNTSLVADNDTLLLAENIEIKVSPAQLLFKRIHIRKVLLRDISINLLQNNEGKWNYEKLVKPAPEDTSKSAFSFVIQAPDIELRNISLRRQTFTNLGSRQIYNNINAEDLRIEELNFNAEVFADVENQNYLMILRELSFKPNLTRFNLRYISGEFAVTKDFASVNKFYFLTDSSEIKINARIDSLNLFGDAALRDFRDYPVTIEAKASPFNFDDLSSFIDATEILKGSPAFEIRAKGKFGAFRIERAKLDYRNTHFDFSGQILNLNVPTKLYIKASVVNTDINYKDVNSLLPNLKLPDYAKMVLTGVNVEYEGEPTNFKAKFLGKVNDGYIEGEGTMNVSDEPMTYDIKFTSQNLDLAALVGFPTKINASASISGKGTSPLDLASNLKLNINNTLLNNITIDKLDLTSQAKDRSIDLTIETDAENAKSIIIGHLQYDNDTIPRYNFIGDINNLNLGRFLDDEKLRSEMNLYFSLEGKGVDPDELNANFVFGIDSSFFQDKWINSSIVETSFKKDSTKREILLASDFVDFKIDGSFSLNKAIELMIYESKTISEIISNKLLELNPLSVVSNSETVKDSVTIEAPDIIYEDIEFDYEFKFKDFDLIAMLMDNEQITIKGSGSGSFSNKAPNFSISAELDLEQFIMMQNNTTIYLSDFLADFNFTRDNRSNSFDKLFGTASITGKRFYTGSSIKSLNADIVFNQSKLLFSASANYDDIIIAEGEGIVLMTPQEQQFLISDLNVNYDGIDWHNKDTIKAFFNPNYFKIVDCKVHNDTSVLAASGVIQSSGDQSLIINGSRISGNILERYAFGLNGSGLTANGSLYGKIDGKFDSPLINFSFDAKDLTLNKNKLGNIKGYMKYAEKKMLTNFVFLDALSNEQKPLFSFDGKFAIDLSFASVNERFLLNEPFYMKFYADNFNLKQLGKIIPGIVDQNGILQADLNIGGTFANPNYSGYVNLTDAYFTSTFNNLRYKCGAKLTFEKNGFIVDSMIVANAGGTNFPGEINGLGSVIFDGFSMKNVNLRFFGDIAIMSRQTQTVSPFFFGDLQIQTDGDWLLTKKGEKFFFKGNILMNKTDLTYTTGRDEALNTNNNLDIVFIVDSSKIDKELIRFQNILAKEKELQKQTDANTETSFAFDYEIGLTSGKDATLTFILGQALNQKLIVEMRGGMKFESVLNDYRAQGSFELLPGSRLEFFKTFDASGFLRFESDVTNPYLDITATYLADYISPRDENQVPQEVAVKIKIKGPLSDLGKNLASDHTAMSVYVGSRNIQNNVRETRYDYADALSFVIMGKFKDDLTAQDKAVVAGETKNAIGSAATSFLGTVLTSFVNSAVGDLINNISINSTGEQTKFSLSGRYDNFSYSLGGTTETFTNLSKANLMLEYRFYPTNLKARFERKDPIVKTYGLDEKIIEMALKYKFEF
ncbi:MAG: hypothetical protein FD143_2082 [Ignavibacteria bacterium]|nr:MAG: hypothetical protein FD143_2082 [Ignavibacteria bacterium]KAF0160426.1 MAG: hypothetical protein FD188_1804 [Ignavibacteria bacterium]